MSNKDIQLSSELRTAVQTIKTAILQSQARAVKGVNQEQLALYYGVGRYISENTRNKKWGSGALKSISERLRQELPGLRGFSETNLKNMRTFYEAWNIIESNSSVATDDLANSQQPTDVESEECIDNEGIVIRQLQLTNLSEFPLAEFLQISFTHHVAILTHAKDINERLF